MSPKPFSVRSWYVRFALRLVFYGLALGFVLWSTASNFDTTEITAWLLFLALAVCFEGVLAVLGGQWPTRSRSGRIDVAFVFLLACTVSAAVVHGAQPCREVVTRGDFDAHERAVLRAFP